MARSVPPRTRSPGTFKESWVEREPPRRRPGRARRPSPRPCRASLPAGQEAESGADELILGGAPGRDELTALAVSGDRNLRLRAGALLQVQRRFGGRAVGDQQADLPTTADALAAGWRQPQAQRGVLSGLDLDAGDRRRERGAAAGRSELSGDDARGQALGAHALHRHPDGVPRAPHTLQSRGDGVEVEDLVSVCQVLGGSEALAVARELVDVLVLRRRLYVVAPRAAVDLIAPRGPALVGVVDDVVARAGERSCRCPCRR